MQNSSFIILFLLALLIASCDKEGSGSEQTRSFDFRTDTDGWQGDFADYPPGEEIFYELAFSHDSLPAPLDTLEGALVLNGNNHSDDLFMFVKKRLSNLEPNRIYEIEGTVFYASDIPDGSFGIGGSPGEAVTLKFGAVTEEPNAILKPDDPWLRMNLDKGNQSVGGADAVVIGNYANGTDQWEYVLLERKTNPPLRATTDENGNLWVLFGTDSGFEGTTTIYIDRIDVRLVPMP